MNKLFGKTAVLVVGTVMAVGLASCASSSSMSARMAKAESVYTDCDFTKKSAGSTVYTTEWTYGSYKILGGANNGANWDYAKFGRKKQTDGTTDTNGYVKSPAIDKAITKIELVILANTKAKVTTTNSTVNVGVTVYSDEAMTDVIDTVEPTETAFKEAGSKNLVPSSGTSWAADSYFKVVINVTTNQTDENGILWVSKINFYQDEEDPRTTVQLHAENMSLDVSAGATDPVITDDAGAPVTGCVLSSNNEFAAKVSEGKIVPVEVGTATINVSKESDAEHHYTGTTFTVTVTEQGIERTNLAFTADVVEDESSTETDKVYKPAEADVVEGVTVLVTADGEKSTFDSNRGIHFGTGSKAVKYIEVKISGIEGNVCKIVVNAAAASGIHAKVAATVGGQAMTLNPDEEVTTAPGLFFLSGSGSGEIVLRLEKDGEEASNGALYIKSISVGIGGEQPTPPGPTPPTPTPTPSGGGSKGCGGDIATVSVILSAISLAGVGLLLLKKRVKE